MDIDKKYEFIVNAYGELMTLINREYKYELVNDSWCKTFGKKREDFIGKTVADVWGKEKFEKELKYKLDIGFSGEIYKEEDAFAIAGEEFRHYSVTYYPYKNDAEKITHVVSVTNDITPIKTINEQLRVEIKERKQAEEELSKYKDHLEELVHARTIELIASRKRFRDLAELLPETVFETDVSGKITFINNIGLEKFGYTKDDVKGGLSAFQLIDKSAISEAKERFDKYFMGEKSHPVEYTFSRKNNTSFSGMLYMNKVSELNDSDMARGIIVDITDQKNIDRKILTTILETEERERKRVAEDLHDGLGSLLSTLNIYIDIIDDNTIDNKERQKHLDYIRGLINEAILNSKEIANNLRPSTLSRFGLVASLNSFCEKVNETKKITINLISNEIKDQIDNQIEISLYRIINELINNTIKYASAKIVNINLIVKDKKLTLLYEDDGVGFDKNEAIKGGGNGLKNILTRVDTINGKCELNSKIGEGIKVIIQINLN